MKDKNVAIVLGGTAPHVLLIEKLKKRGFYTILVDYLSNSPGVKVADEHIQESTLDKEAVLKIAKEKNADLIISTCIDQANSTCCYVAEKLNLPRPYSYETSLNVTNKGLMKRIMKDNNIPTSDYFLINDLAELKLEKIVYPVVVKPVDCNSSKGVHKADNPEEVKLYVEEAIKLSRTNNAIVEGFNEGFEIQVDCFAKKNGAEVVMTRQKQKIQSENEMVLQSFGSIIPARLSENLNKQAREIASKIAEAFELKNTPFFYQAIVADKGINVLEFAPRIGGGLSYYLLKEIAGFDMVEAAIDSFIGKEVSFCAQEPKKYYSTNILYMNPGIFDRIDNLDELKEKGIIKEHFQMKNRGTVIDKEMSSGNRVGAFIVEANNYEELFFKAREAFESIEIYDIEGYPALNRSAYSLKGGI